MPPAQGIDWESFLRLVVVHGVGPLLHATWREELTACPPGLLAELRRQRHQSALHGKLALAQRDEVLEILQRAGVPALVLKGAALGLVWYEDVSLRPFLDIDLLVPSREMARAKAALTEEGYHDVPHPRAPHHDLPLHRPGAVCSVELHYTLTRLPLTDALPFETLQRRAIAVHGDDVSVHTLGPEDTLLLLCLHTLSHLEHDHGWQLRQLCDIARHLQAFTIDWADFTGMAEGLNAARICRAVLGLAAITVGASVPSEHCEVESARTLLRFPVPGQTEHRLLADFLAALRQLDFRHAVGMVQGTVITVEWDTGGGYHLRPGKLAHIVARLWREAVRDPAALIRQLRLWLPEAKKRRQREQLLADLLTPPGTGLPRSADSSPSQ